MGASAQVKFSCVPRLVALAPTYRMFAMPIFEISTKLRDGPAQAFSEFVATFGLLATILGAVRFRPSQIAPLVGLYIAAAYWFTGSMSFANPAVTLARSLSDSFAGIAPSSVPVFVAAQIAGGLAGWFVFRLLAKPAQAEMP
jgi:glycerol uptake facilitator-like aquaporin